MVMRMEEGLDTGPVALTIARRSELNVTAGELHDELSDDASAKLCVRALDQLERGDLAFTPQPEAGVVYAHKIDKAESRIDWK